jgi:hypothetical protein
MSNRRAVPAPEAAPLPQTPRQLRDCGCPLDRPQGRSCRHPRATRTCLVLQLHRLPISLAPMRVWTSKIQAAPTDSLSFGPPTRAILPLQESDTDVPCSEFPIDPAPTSLPGSRAQAVPVRLNTRAAPRPLLSIGAPRMAVVPSPDNRRMYQSRLRRKKLSQHNIRLAPRCQLDVIRLDERSRRSLVRNSSATGSKVSPVRVQHSRGFS